MNNSNSVLIIEINHIFRTLAHHPTPPILKKMSTLIIKSNLTLNGNILPGSEIIFNKHIVQHGNTCTYKSILAVRDRENDFN